MHDLRKQLSNLKTRPVCVHADTSFNDPSVSCGAAIHKGYHGWLCVGHYRAEQMSIPKAPRIPWQPYKGLVPKFQTDEQIVADILRTEADLIGQAYRGTGNRIIRRVRFGAIEPEYVQYVEKID